MELTLPRLTEAAVAKAEELLARESTVELLRLRIAVQPGGCSGLRYQLFFDTRFLEGDVTADYGEVELIVDRMSLPYLSSAVIDYHDSLEKQGFSIDNPGASGSCACGDSFH